MAALGCTFSCLVPQPEAVQLKGAGAKSPLFAGQTIVAHGMYDDASETGPGIFLVLRQVGSIEYVMAPLGSTDSHWESHLKSATTVKALLWKDVKDPIPNDRELLRRWQVVAAAGDEPKNSSAHRLPPPTSWPLGRLRRTTWSKSGVFCPSW